MKRKLAIGLLLVAVLALGFGNTYLSKNAETIPPEPAGIVIYK